MTMHHLYELIDRIAAARFERNDEEEASAILKTFTSSRASQPKEPLHKSSVEFYAELDASQATGLRSLERP
jgi:hypothetical protein